MTVLWHHRCCHLYVLLYLLTMDISWNCQQKLAPHVIVCKQSTWRSLTWPILVVDPQRVLISLPFWWLPQIWRLCEWDWWCFDIWGVSQSLPPPISTGHSSLVCKYMHALEFTGTIRDSPYDSGGRDWGIFKKKKNKSYHSGTLCENKIKLTPLTIAAILLHWLSVR